MIVETYYIRGVKVNIDDSAYAGKSEEELAAVRSNIEQTARQIYQAVERRKVNCPGGAREDGLGHKVNAGEGGREGSLGCSLGRKAEKQKSEERMA